MSSSKPGARQYLRDYSVILTISLVGYAVRYASGKFDNEFNFILFVTSLALIGATWEFLNVVNARLNRILPFEHGIAKRIVAQLVIGALFGLFIRFLIYKLGEPYLPVPLDTLFLASTWFLYMLVTSSVNAFFFVDYFIQQWKAYLIKSERLEKEKSQIQFDNLKNHLNPHFLFNALTSLNGLIFEDQRLASDFLQQLSKVYRYVLQHGDRNFVTLKTELDFIHNYIQLLETRFRGSLKINLDIAAHAQEQAIVPVTLQVLIENAIKHNIVDKDRPLTIDLVTIGDYLVVGNNLQERKSVESSNKKGLERLRSLYGFLTERPVIVEKTDDRFNVKVPLI